jgi:hypothetical protein
MKPDTNASLLEFRSRRKQEAERKDTIKTNVVTSKNRITNALFFVIMQALSKPEFL